MTTLLADSESACRWIEQTKDRFSKNLAFGSLVGAVLWTEHPAQDAEPLVPVDPDVLVAKVNDGGFPLLRGHDPGSPLGKTLAAEVFVDGTGRRFVAGVLGFYHAESCPRFEQLGLDSLPPATSPTLLPPLDDEWRLLVATDPREVQPEWLDDILRDVPFRVGRTELSHNAAEPIIELIRIGLPYLLVVWNPFVTEFAKEGAKEAYASVSRWFRTFFTRLSERHNPIVDVQSYQDGCTVSFLFRGNDVTRNYAAHDALPMAGAQAAQLIANMNQRGVPPKTLVYEFEADGNRWFPSYAELLDGTLVAQRNILIAIENLPSGLSLGLLRDTDKQHLR
jgi:hypothetical protein